MPGTLYIVATPIGNLSDASPRSIEVLRSVAVIACEDTRTSRPLLARHGVAARAVALHAHNERRAGARLLAILREGKDVALVSDAGTPGVSDPGALLVAAAHAAGIRVAPVPGPSAAIAAYSVSGFGGARFHFLGFPERGWEDAIDALDPRCPVILYEAPHRILQTIDALVARFGPGRELVVARELTKMFEEVARLKLGEARAWLESRAERMQGEFVLVLGPGEAKRKDALAEGERVLAILKEALPASEAARLAARISGAPRNALYREAIKRNQ
jgi:16S rRNA (cytidine1402-2'-O)-methyltransferase